MRPRRKAHEHFRSRQENGDYSRAEGQTFESVRVEFLIISLHNAVRRRRVFSTLKYLRD